MPSLYTLDERSIVGLRDVDDAHREIAKLSRDLSGMLASSADFAEVRDLFARLTEVLLAHFYVEETAIRDMGEAPEVRDHLARHLANHGLFRDAVSAIEKAFAEGEAQGDIPDIPAFIPPEAVEDLKDLDREMADLLRRHAKA